MNIFQQLYDNEINFSLTTFWDAGFEVRLGDSMNGFKAEDTCETMEKAAKSLREMAIAYYPDIEEFQQEQQ